MSCGPTINGRSGRAVSLAGVASVLDSQGELVIVNTNVRQVLYSFDVPANALALGGMLRLTLDGVFSQTTGVSHNQTLDVSFGGVQLYQSPATSVASNAALRPVSLAMRIRQTQALAATMQAQWRMIATTAPPVGYGTLTTGPTNDGEMASDVAASDPTTARTLEVGMTLSFASPNFSFTRRGATLELLQAA